MAQSSARNPLVWMVVIAAPMAFGLETLLRSLFFPPDFELIRDFLRPYLTPVAWIMVVVIALAGLLAHLVQGRMVKKRLARIPPEMPARRRYTASVGVFLLTSSIPQVPTILATFLFMFGAHVAPVATSVALCSVAVIAQALRIPKLIEGEREPSSGATPRR